MTKTTVRKTNGKIKRTIASMLAAVMVMTTAATIAASADTTQAVVHMNTCAAMRNESDLDTTIHIPFGMDIDVIDTARNLTEKTLDKIIDHFAPCDIVKDILNKGAAYFLNWAFPGEEKEKEPTITDVIDKIDVVEEKLKSYHNEEMSKLKALGSKIDSEPFRNQIDQVSSDTRKVINALKAHKCNITTTDDGVIDTTTYKTYRTILGETCKFDVMMTHLMDMEGFVLGYKYGTDKQEGFGLYSKYLVDCVNDRSIDYDFEKAPDFNIVRDCINGELQSMEAMCVLDTLCLMTLNNMRYKIRQYEIENGKYHVESNEKPFSSFENEADEIADYLRNISAKYKATVEHNNKTVVGAELTIDGETKGFATFTEAWAAGNISDAKSFTIKLGEDLITDKKKGLNFDDLNKDKYGYNSQNGFKVKKGLNITVDLGGHKIFTAYNERKFAEGNGSNMPVFELDGNLTLKNGMIEGGKNAVRVTGAQTAVLDNVTIYRTQGPSITCVGKNETVKMTNCTIKYAELGKERKPGAFTADDRYYGTLYQGGAIYAHGFSRGKFVISNCLFEKNTNASGGAIILPNDPAAVTIENCTFRGNRAKSVASAIWGGSAATIRNCRFENNISATKIDCQKDTVICTSQAKQVNCTFVGNSHVDKIPELDYAAEIAREKREAEEVLR